MEQNDRRPLSGGDNMKIYAIARHAFVTKLYFFHGVPSIKFGVGWR